MADNLTAFGNAGSGTDVLATDEIAGVHYPRTKLTIGANGVNDGDVSSANPMPVTMSALKAEDDPAVSGDLGLPLLAMRSATDAPTTSADGDYTLLKVDEEGRLKVASKPASYAATTGNITANAQTVFINCERFSNLMIHCAGTFAGANITFEGSLNSTNGTDGNWFAVQAVRTNANTIELTTGVLAAAPAYAWELSVNALKYFRIRATAFTSGTQVWTFIPGTYATEPIPAAQVSGTQPVSGTVTATVSGAGISGGTISPLTVAGVTLEASAARTATANGTTITNASGRGAMFYINVSAVSGTTPTLTVRLQVQDPVSLGWIDITPAVTPAISTVSLTMLTVCPGISEAANSRVAQALPRVFRMAWVITGTTPSFTFSIGAQYII